MDDPKKINQVISKVKASASHKIFLSSKSLWDQLGIKRRTPHVIGRIAERFFHSGIEIILEGYEFGKEPDDQRIDLKYWDIPVPDDQWFEEMSSKSFENEEEVLVFFLAPLFSKLGYQEMDFSFEYPVDLSPKVANRGKRDRLEKVDLVLFDGTDRSDTNVLVLCEAKKPDDEKARRKLSNLELAEQESRDYCLALTHARRRIATNADVIRVYRVIPNDPEPIIEIHRSELKQRWHQFYLCLGKPVLLEEK